MLKKTVFALAAVLTVAAPFAIGDGAQAQSGITLQCYHDGNPKHFRPECREELKFPEPAKKVVTPTSPRNRVEFSAENLFEQMMLDSGGGGGGGGGGR